MKRPAKSRARKRTQTVRGGLKGFADARKPAVDLLRDIQTHVVAEGVKNANVGREDHLIHVSELIKDPACPRYMFYKVTKAERTDPAAPAFHRLEIIWATGHDAHHKWQRWLREMGDLFGSWTCLVCEFKWEATSPQECPECGSGLLRYDEVNLGTHLLVGHADGAVPRLNALIEVKSFAVGTVRIDSPALVAEHTHKIDGRTVIDHDGLWKAIKRPLRSHLVQGLMYLWMCREMGLSYDRIIFIYENKTTQATKTFEVKLTERNIEKYLSTLEEVGAFAAEGVTPARPKLFTPDAKPCKECVFRTGCWSDDSTESPAVSAGGSRPGGEETGRAAAVRSARSTDEPDSGRARGHHRTGRRRSDRDDDAPDQVDRAPRRATRDGRGGRAVGRRSTGEGTSPRFTRKTTGSRRGQA